MNENRHQQAYMTKAQFHNKTNSIKYAAYVQREEIESGIRPDGSIDLTCPCMHSIMAHRCGHDFRLAIACFNKSTTEPRGYDCMEEFKNHALCLKKCEK